MSSPVGGRYPTNASPHFPVPLLRRPGCVSLQRQPDDIQIGVIVGRPLHGSVRVDHVHANNPS
jgi:hypothetical protein